MVWMRFMAHLLLSLRAVHARKEILLIVLLGILYSVEKTDIRRTGVRFLDSGRLGGCVMNGGRRRLVGLARRLLRGLAFGGAWLRTVRDRQVQPVFRHPVR